METAVLGMMGDNDRRTPTAAGHAQGRQLPHERACSGRVTPTSLTIER